jgi:hypothetical protein
MVVCMSVMFSSDWLLAQGPQSRSPGHARPTILHRPYPRPPQRQLRGYLRSLGPESHLTLSRRRNARCWAAGCGWPAAGLPLLSACSSAAARGQPSSYVVAPRQAGSSSSSPCRRLSRADSPDARHADRLPGVPIALYQVRLLTFAFLHWTLKIPLPQ